MGLSLALIGVMRDKIQFTLVSTPLNLCFRATKSYASNLHQDMSDYQYVNSDYEDEVAEDSPAKLELLDPVPLAPSYSHSPQLANGHMQDATDKLSVDK